MKMLQESKHSGDTLQFRNEPEASDQAPAIMKQLGRNLIGAEKRQSLIILMMLFFGGLSFLDQFLYNRGCFNHPSFERD